AVGRAGRRLLAAAGWLVALGGTYGVVEGGLRTEVGLTALAGLGVGVAVGVGGFIFCPVEAESSVRSPVHAEA
ncbi:MAG TPA: hypothetical protein VNK43_07630, partial [Gemmatimonadales bacterium]|nr:hypothetical protein [Gemmatimonadales bacterium]